MTLSFNPEGPPPEPEPEPAATPRTVQTEAWDEEKFFRVVLNLEGGDWVEVESFSDEDDAEECAKKLVESLARRSDWPRIRGRYLRPETIVSVEISERRRYAGSAARAEWSAGNAPPAA